MGNMTDEETVCQLQENIYMQYFIGYSSFSTEPPFSATLFVEIRKRLGIEKMNLINERIVALGQEFNEVNPSSDSSTANQVEEEPPQENIDADSDSSSTYQGRLLIDATAYPQAIAYPTDLNILNDARIKSEGIIDT